MGRNIQFTSSGSVQPFGELDRQQQAPKPAQAVQNENRLFTQFEREVVQQIGFNYNPIFRSINSQVFIIFGEAFRTPNGFSVVIEGLNYTIKLFSLLRDFLVRNRP